MGPCLVAVSSLLTCQRQASGEKVTLGAWVLQLWPSSLVAQLPSLKDLVKEALQYQGLDQDVSAEHK